MKTSIQFHTPIHDKKKVIFVTIFLSFLIIISGIWFVVSYNRLNQSIQNERVESVGEIGNVILEKVKLASEGYSKEVENFANLLSASNVTTLEELNNYFGYDSNICLLQNDGKCYDLAGNVIHLLDIQSIFSGISVEKVNSNFCSISTKGDFWIFSIGVENVTIDNQKLAGVLKLVDINEYEKVTTSNIFGNQGATYIINNDGVVLFRPVSPSTTHFFQGYNIIQYLRDSKVSEEEIKLISDTLNEHSGDGKKTDILISIDKIMWLVQVIPNNDNQNIVLTVPISITAKATFDNMRATIISIFIVIVFASMLFILWMLTFNYRNNVLKLEQAKANSKSDFMNKISHDIRTPLNVIVGMIEIAKRVKDDDSSLNNCLDSIRSSSEYLVSIINDVLDVGKIEKGKMSINKKPFNLKVLLAEIEKMESYAAQSKNIKLHFENNIPDRVLYIGDSTRIKQCLVNLISNAIKFTLDGGHVTVQCFDSLSEDEERNVTFIVSDTGIGMSKEFIEKLFQPFEQEYAIDLPNNSGSGLGLSIVYHLTSLMGGTINVDSKKDAGSCFTIELPLIVTEDTSDNKIKDLVFDENILRGKRVLLAEDNEINRDIVSYFLEEMGLEVDVAVNGQVAFEKFTNSPENYYDVILMDIQMPILNGLEATKKIRSSKHKNANDVLIIALSANAYSEDALKSYEAGMQAHLVKPLEPKILKEALTEYITLREMQGEKND